MAKIMNVDYKAIPAKAKSIRAYGQKINSELTKAYKSISNMHTSWYGKRYNALVKDFNSMVSDLNALLDLVVGELPFVLETVANNYSKADTGSTTTTATKTTPTKITALEIHDDTGMKFVSSEVIAIKTKVSNNFKNAKGYMDNIETTYGQIKWQSEAATAFATQFKKVKGKVVTSFENIKTNFTKLMAQTESDIQSAETANTVTE